MIALEIAGMEVDGRFFAETTAAETHLEQKLNAISDRATMAVGDDIMKTLQKVGQKLREKHNSPWNGRLINDKNELQSRSGNSMRAILETIRQTKNTINVVAGEITTANSTIHETGGTVSAKRSKYLTIPLPAAMDSRGVPLRKKARDWDNTFVARSKRGSLLIYRKDGKGIVPLYLLKQSVRIPARLGMELEVEDALPIFERRAFETLARILEEAP